MNSRTVLSNKVILMLMAIPCLTLVIIFNYVPLYGWLYGFFSYKPGMKLSQSEFVGLKYIMMALNDRQLPMILRNTLILGSLNILSNIFPITFAILLNELKGKRSKRVIQTVTTFPNFISWVLVFSVFFLFLSVDDGYINKVLLGIGIIKEPLNLLASESAVWPLQLFISNWKTVGFSSVIYLAAIAGIDPSLYESVEIDGGGRLAKILYVTLPGIMATFFVLVLLGIGNILSTGFEQYYLFYNNLVSDKILVLDVYLYQVGIGMNMFSMSTALGMSKTLISLILLFSANALSKAARGTSII